jgi:hypothetical protein
MKWKRSMQCSLTVLLIGLAALSQADEIEPAVNTSSVDQPAPTNAEPTPQSTAPQPVPTPPTAAGTPATKSAPPAKQAAGGKSSARDEILLDPTQITGNRELPNVMYVVPWKRPDIGDMGGRPPKSLIDEALSPVDRDVFRRQNRYFATLQAQSASAPAQPTVPPPGGATITLPTGDEK